MDDLSQKILEINKKRFFSKCLMFAFSSYSILLVIFAVLNEGKDPLFELFFFSIVAFAAIFNFFFLFSLKYIKLNDQNKRQVLLKRYEDLNLNCRITPLAYLQPLVLGNFSILVFELRTSIYFYPILALLIIFTVIILIRMIALQNYTSKNYEEISGKKLIVLFP